MWACEKARERNWITADRATVTDFGDMSRVDLYWNDGAAAGFTRDTREEAFKRLAELGFEPITEEAKCVATQRAGN